MPLGEHEPLLREKQGRGGEHTGRSSGLRELGHKASRLVLPREAALSCGPLPWPGMQQGQHGYLAVTAAPQLPHSAPWFLP